MGELKAVGVGSNVSTCPNSTTDCPPTLELAKAFASYVRSNPQLRLLELSGTREPLPPQLASSCVLVRAGLRVMAGKPWETDPTSDNSLRALASLVSQAQQLRGFTIASTFKVHVPMVHCCCRNLVDQAGVAAISQQLTSWEVLCLLTDTKLGAPLTDALAAPLGQLTNLQLLSLRGTVPW